MRSICLAFVFLVFNSPAFSASELIMFNSSYCEWCELWEEEVGVVYDKTWEARIVPIRRVDIHEPRPDGLKQIKPVIYTPTFVMIHNGLEVDRILGYPDEGHFWGLLDEMVKRLPTPLNGCLKKTKMAATGTDKRTGPNSC